MVSSSEEMTIWTSPSPRSQINPVLWAPPSTPSPWPVAAPVELCNAFMAPSHLLDLEFPDGERIAVQSLIICDFLIAFPAEIAGFEEAIWWTTHSVPDLSNDMSPVARGKPRRRLCGEGEPAPDQEPSKPIVQVPALMEAVLNLLHL